MTAVDVCFHCNTPPDDRRIRGIDRLWEVYGIRRIHFEQREQSIRVEYDATRMNAAMVATLLRRAGLDIGEQLVLA